MNLLQRPLTLKLAFVFATMGLVIGIVYVVLDRAAYGDGWVLFVPARIFLSIIWLALLILALNGRNWVRYIYGGFVLLGLVLAAIRYPELLFHKETWLIQAPSILAAVFFFFPQSNAWYESVRHLATQQNAQADAG